MTFGQMILILRARWRVALAVLAVVVITMVSVSLVLPKQFTASASVVIDVAPDPISMRVVDGPMMPAFMATQIDILKSDRVARLVVKALNLASDTESRRRWTEDVEGRGDFESWLASALQRSLDVKPARDSNVINVSYQARDAKYAALVANAYVQAYIDTVRDLRIDPAKQYSNFFEGRANELKSQLETAQANLTAYQKQKGIIATDERLDVETARMNELSAQVVAMQSLSAESGGRQSAAQGRSAESMQDVLLNPVISGLKANLSQQEARLNELNSRYGDNHPQVIEAKANLDSLRRRLQSETARVTSGVSVSNMINRQREAEIRGAYEAQRQRVLRLKEQRDEASGLLRDVETAQKAYDAVLARVNQAALESQSKTTNVSLLNPAFEPLFPSSPKVFVNALVGIFLGTMLAIATALGLEALNRKVRSAEDITHSLGVPVIGVMPRPDRLQLLGKGSQPLLVRRVLGQLPMPDSRRA